jgi:hypothetical protein
MKSKLNYRREIEKEGYKVVRGSFVGTPDDRIDRWYIDHADTPYVDRRGAGYKTLEEAYNSIMPGPDVPDMDGDNDAYYLRRWKLGLKAYLTDKGFLIEDSYFD